MPDSETPQTDADVYGTIEYGDGTDSVHFDRTASKPDHGPTGSLTDTVYTDTISSVDDLEDIAEQWAFITTRQDGESVPGIGMLVPREEIQFQTERNRLTLETTEESISLRMEFSNINGELIQCVEPEEWWVSHIEDTPGDRSQFHISSGRDIVREVAEDIPQSNPYSGRSFTEGERWVRAENETATTGPAGEHGAPVYLPLEDCQTPGEYPGTSYQNIPIDLTENTIRDGWESDHDLSETVLCATRIECVPANEVPDQQ
jgi:hypothetical protein